MFFKCKVCNEKDQRIAELKERIAFLEYYIQPTKADPLPYAIEAQKILEGSMAPVIDLSKPSKDKLDEMRKIKMEEEKMLSGDEIIYE